MALDTLHRRDRYAPTSTGKRVSPRPRDVRWFRALADHGPLPSHYLHTFTEEECRNPKSSRIRLTDLASETDTPHRGAYLVRPAAQRRMENARNRSLIYDLSDAGWRALDGRRQEAARPGGPFAHQLMVACVTASIELACLKRGDIRYIHGGEILKRAGTTLAADVPIDASSAGRHRLVTDQLFALEHRTSRGSLYVSYVVECDRGTEPITASGASRKSYLCNYLQYRAFVGEGLYREHYCLKAPMLVLNVMNSVERQRAYMDLIASLAPNGNAFMLFQTIGGFGASFAPPPLMPKLLAGTWDRVGHDPICIGGP